MAEPPSTRRGGHGDGRGKRARVTADAVELFQQHIGHAGLIDALHHHVDVRGGEDAVILGLEALRRHIDELAGVAAQLDARGGVAVEFAAGLPHAVETLRVELGLKAAGLGLGLDAHGLGVERAVHKIRVKDRAEHDVGVGIGQILPRQCVSVLDAADVGGKHAVGARAGKVNAEVRAVQLGQTAGQGGHIGAGRIAALQDKSQHGGISGRFPPGRETQMQRDAAAVKFSSIQRGDVYAGCELFTFQIVIPFKHQ